MEATMPFNIGRRTEPDQLRLLMAEDSVRLGPLLVDALREAGYSVDLAVTAQDFQHLAETSDYALFIIDLGLPDEDGMQLISWLRESNVQQPVLIITARVGLDDKIAGLDIGADDYLVKPFNQRELLARVRALLRRPQTIAPSFKHVSGLTLDLQTQEIMCDGRIINLTPSEQRLLSLFLRRGDRIVTPEDVEQLASDQSREISENAVQQAISRLRKQLERLDPCLKIQTIRGSGYKLTTRD